MIRPLSMLMFLSAAFVGCGAYIAASFFAPGGCTVIKDLSQLRADWPNLGRYYEEDSKLNEGTTTKSRVVFYGDSITDYWIERSPEFFRVNGYVDRGIAGQTTPQMLVRFRQDVIDIGASVVVLLGGINDITGKTGISTQKMIQNNIVSMVQLSQAAGIVPILASLLPANRPGRKEKIDAMNEWLKTYARSQDLIYIDYNRALSDDLGGLRPQLTDDGIHPNKEGYKVMEPLAKAAIFRATHVTNIRDKTP